MKKKMLIIVPAVLVLSSCNFDLSKLAFWKKTPPKTGEEQTIDDIDVGELTNHATRVTCDPNAPFYLKVGDTKVVDVSFDITPTDEEEKKFTWQLSNECVSFVVDPDDSSKATVKGERAGNAKLTAKNTYNQSLIGIFDIKVIDFDSENMYLWQYKSEDRKQFGYDSNNAKQGTTTGVAVLGGKEWSYSRNRTTSLQSANGAVGFGKGGEPETLISLSSHNTRTIKEVVLETSSANSLATCKVKVGETEIINKKAPAVSKTSGVAMLSSESNLNVTGDITITYETPEFDQAAYDADPASYAEPGAVYLKSILITYEEDAEPEYATESTIDFVDIYNNKEDNASFWTGITKTGKAKDYTQDGIGYHFEKISISDDSTYFNTNDKIIISAPQGELIYKVELHTAKIKSTNNTYDGFGSIVNGEPYSYQFAEGAGNELKFRVDRDHINSVMLKNKGTTNIGLVSLTVKTIAGEHAIIQGVNFANEAVPSKTSYNAGELFDPAGLGNATATFANSQIDPLQIPVECFKFYDGVSYDNNSSTASETLSAGTTYVYAVYKNFAIKIEGITVVDVPISLTLVKNISEITDSGRYYFVCVSTSKMLKGSLGTDMSKTTAIENMADVSFTNTATISGKYANDAMKILTVDGGVSIKCLHEKENMIGMTDAGKISTAAKPTNKVFTLTIDAETGIATFEITGGSPEVLTRYLQFGANKIDLFETSSPNISIYKAA